MTKFSEWMTRKFLEWQADQGKRKTLEEFATYVGVSRPLINMWMNGNQKPGKENIKYLAEIFGNEVYDVLEIPRPNPYLQRVNRRWEFLPESVQKKIDEETAIYETENISKQLPKASKQRKTGKAE